MTFRELMLIRGYSVAARQRAIQLDQAGIKLKDFLPSMIRFSDSYDMVVAYMESHDIK